MNLKSIINKSVYGTIGYISCEKDLEILEWYILYNLPVLKEYKQIVVATNYGASDWHVLQKQRKNNFELWRKYFPNCILIDSKLNRGHNFGTTDLDNMLFDWCKDNNEEWLCKSSNDVIINNSILDIEVKESDFYYLNGISYETLNNYNFDYNKLYKEHFYPQTNFYLINVSKCDYLNDDAYINETYEYSKTIPNYNGKIWEYIKNWSCEDFVKNCVNRNNLSKYYLLDENQNKNLCDLIYYEKIGDPSHKNIMVNGICHFHKMGEIYEI